MKTLIETSAEVNYNQALQAIEITWKGFADTSQYKKILWHALDMIKEYGCSVWISDMTNGKAVTRESIEWMRSIFVPRSVQLGVKKMGFLVTGNAFAKLHAANLKIATKEHGIEMNYFDSRSELEEWIYTT